MNISRVLGPLVAAVVMLAAAPAAADPPPYPRDRWILDEDLVGRYGPAGAMLFAGALYRRVSGYDARRGDSSHPMFRPGSAPASTPPMPSSAPRSSGSLSPSSSSAPSRTSSPTSGPTGRCSPSSGAVPFGDAAIAARAGEARAAIGGRGMIQPTLRAKLGPVIVRNQTDVAHYRFAAAGPFFYEWEYDTLLARSDVLVADRIQVMIEAWKRGSEAMLLVGPVYDVTHAFAAALTRQRLGLALYWVPVEAWGRVRRPRIYGQGGANLEDPNRRGEPFFVVGIGNDFDL